MTAFLVLTFSSLASADDHAMPANLNEFVSTPLGDVRAYTVRNFCYAQRVYIADVTDVVSYETTLNGRFRIESDVELTILHPLKGAYPSPVQVHRIPGGRVGDSVIRVIDALLVPSVGKRYVLSQQQYTDEAGTTM